MEKNEQNLENSNEEMLEEDAMEVEGVEIAEGDEEWKEDEDVQELTDDEEEGTEGGATKLGGTIKIAVQLNKRCYVDLSKVNNKMDKYNGGTLITTSTNCLQNIMYMGEKLYFTPVKYGGCKVYFKANMAKNKAGTRYTEYYVRIHIKKTGNFEYAF